MQVRTCNDRLPVPDREVPEEPSASWVVHQGLAAVVRASTVLDEQLVDKAVDRFILDVVRIQQPMPIRSPFALDRPCGRPPLAALRRGPGVEVLLRLRRAELVLPRGASRRPLP
eukprot:CAMPEP_0115466036 /NCGR_PEP_ID=MMETSP0271-20121206/49709_1 /TAXON_ID=71861 /ORGANISM="Scrippsiella trochoidea, Strain CCMP3099" /LENGTH=113 /DNA_ID=CAMNT_0002892995 /DNA_START=178 /DNA_END=516 /DNA_ORIENTATION=+